VNGQRVGRRAPLANSNFAQLHGERRKVPRGCAGNPTITNACLKLAAQNETTPSSRYALYNPNVARSRRDFDSRSYSLKASIRWSEQIVRQLSLAHRFLFCADREPNLR
jgi:hypothetical protein